MFMTMKTWFIQHITYTHTQVYIQQHYFIMSSDVKGDNMMVDSFEGNADQQ